MACPQKHSNVQLDDLDEGMTRTKTTKLIRPLIRNLHAYVPGEQPKIKGLIKLNTNENPYPPSPKVLQAVRSAVDGRLRLYPNPTAQSLREALAKFHGCRAANIIVGNGSDELLALAVRAFVEPEGRVTRVPNINGKLKVRDSYNSSFPLLGNYLTGGDAP